MRQDRDTDPRAHFAELARRPDAEIALSLGEGALWIAAESYPGLEVDAYTAKLDALAQSLRQEVEAAPTPAAQVQRMVHALFGDQGFSGNRADYYDPRNSYLNEVLDRRLGIPITLCVLFIEVARRLGLDASGVAFPGHFLAKVSADSEIMVDAFAGRTLTRSDCMALWTRVRGEGVPFDPQCLRAASARTILARMLGNLKQIYLRRKDWSAALSCCDRVLLLAPDSAIEFRDRGLLYHRLECFGAAVEDLERFLELAPDGVNRSAVERALVRLRARVQRLH